MPDIILNDRDWYAEHGITLHLGKKVTQIDRIRRLVISADGTTAAYDRLLIATGSQPSSRLSPATTCPVFLAIATSPMPKR